MKRPLANPPHIWGDFVFRDLAAADRDEVLRFTANTWQGGDYIGYVYDDWHADTVGRFICAVHSPTGEICAIDKLTMLTPTSAWFEGLRVHPDYRGKGLASALQRYVIAESIRLGATHGRLITDSGNVPIHRTAYRDGFTMSGLARFWKWKAAPAIASPHIPSPERTPPLTLRRADPNEAALLLENWRRSSAWRTGGLVHHFWGFGATSLDEWTALAEQGLLFVANDPPLDPRAMPAPSVLLRADTNHEDEPIWVFAAVTALDDQWPALMSALVEHAVLSGIAEINGLLPDVGEVSRSLPQVGFVVEDYALAIFELDLRPASAHERATP